MSFPTFRSILKLAEITPVYKNDSRYEKSNYQAIIVLPNLSTIFENILYEQIFVFFESILSKYETGFKKGFNWYNCLAATIEKFQKIIDQWDKYVALLTDLSKTFDCLPHDLILVKWHAG